MGETTLRDTRPLFLVGFMGIGKTSVGRHLAQMLGYEFFDTDELVERREDQAIETLFLQRGEAFFREAEWRVLRSLDGRERCVVATGGGLFSAHDRRRWMLRRGTTVWLDVPLEAVRRRLGDGSGRPVWSRSDPLELRVLFERRRAAYSLAHLRVPGHPGSPAEVARRVIDRIRAVFC